MEEKASATAFHCTRCNNISEQRASLTDPAGTSRRLDIYDCPNCGKIDLRLFHEPANEEDGKDPSAESK
jgi:hypothetical protein